MVLNTINELKTDFKLGIEHEKHAETEYEVILNLTIVIKQEDKVTSHLQIKQAGIFKIEGYEAEALDYLLKTYCSSLLFPYLRQKAVLLTQEGGLSPIELPLMDFNAIYQQQKQQVQQAQTAVQESEAA
jgi:preprotein translocase subunit SecB